MKIAHISDSHFDERDRLEETLDLHLDFCQQIDDRNVDLVIHTGDLYERKSTPAEREAVASFLIRAAGLAPVLIIRGNHDQPGDIDYLSRLRGDNQIWTAEEFKMGYMGPIFVVCMPWIDRSRWNTNDVSTVLSAARSHCHNHKEPSLLAAHVQVGGATISNGQTLIGSTHEIPAADLLDVGADYIALGHIHKHQTWTSDEQVRMAYAGSPRRCNFGEPEDKGWVLVEIEDGKTTATFEPLVVPAMHTWDVSDLGRLPGKRDWKKGDMMRFRFHIRPEDMARRDTVEAELREKYDGAELKIEWIVEHTTRTRAPELVGGNMSTIDKVKAYLGAKSIDVTDDEMARIEVALGQLEGR